MSQTLDQGIRYTHMVLQLKSVKDIWGTQASIEVLETKDGEYGDKFMRCRTVADLKAAGCDIGDATDPLPYEPIGDPEPKPWTDTGFWNKPMPKIARWENPFLSSYEPVPKPAPRIRPVGRHSFAWSGQMPCTGVYQCKLCGHIDSEAHPLDYSGVDWDHPCPGIPANMRA